MFHGHSEDLVISRDSLFIDAGETRILPEVAAMNVDHGNDVDLGNDDNDGKDGNDVDLGNDDNDVDLGNDDNDVDLGNDDDDGNVVQFDFVLIVETVIVYE